MSGQPFECGYGAIVQEDVQVLEQCLAELCGAFGGNVVATNNPLHPIRICEIGMHDGGTARGIEAFLLKFGRRLEYYGIDPDDGSTRPRYVPEGGKVVIGDSAEVFNQIPDGLDLVWVDGCHCRGHIILDTVNYGERVRPGGFMLFHDVNPAGQGQEHQYHGPEIPEFGLAIDMAHKAIRFPWHPWVLFAEAWPTDRHNCGTRAYRKEIPF